MEIRLFYSSKLFNGSENYYFLFSTQSERLEEKGKEMMLTEEEKILRFQFLLEMETYLFYFITLMLTLIFLILLNHAYTSLHCSEYLDSLRAHTE
jgi:hypothetical protein